MPWLIFLTFFLFAPGVRAADFHPGGKFWITFTAKDTAALSPRQLRADWPERSLNRRAKADAELDAFDLPVNPAYIEQVRTCGATVVETSRWLNAISAYVPDADTRDALAALDCIAGIQPVARASRQGYDLESTEPLPPTFEYLTLGGYGPSFHQAEQAGVIEAHKRGLTGSGVLLGALDSGFMFDHRAFTAVELVAQYDFIYDDPDPSYNFWTDPVGQANHGTACLSVIVGYDPGYLMGIAPRAAVAVGKTEAVGSETPVEEDYWIAGIEWLEWLGADVVTSSLTYRDWYSRQDMDGQAAPVTRAAERAARLGMVICTSAGNEGPQDVTLGAPSDAESVLAIAAVDSNGEVTNFSSRGPSADGRIKPDVAAMGRGVVCVQPHTWDRYGRWNGTSLSCPIVAGVAVLLVEAHPDWHPALIREALRETASRAFSPDNETGYGIVNAAAALDYPSIQGRITCLDARSLPGEISIALQQGAARYQTTPDRWGYYAFPNLPEGIYDLAVTGNDSLLYNADRLQVPPSLPFDINLK